MTFWQRLCGEYPEMQKYGCKHKAVKCPSQWGYEQQIRGECARRKSCAECWNREIPERRDTEK